MELTQTIDNEEARLGPPKETEPSEESLRYRSLPLDKIDHEHLASHVCTQWRQGNDSRAQFMEDRERWSEDWRDSFGPDRSGPMGVDSSNHHVPMTRIYMNAVHARLWQLFTEDFFGVKARRELYQDREVKIKEYMQYLIWNYCNLGQGLRDVFDDWLFDEVADGSGYLKLYWARRKHTYLEVVPVMETQEAFVIDPSTQTGRTELNSTITEREEIRTEIIESPAAGTIALEDILLPPGQSDPQTADYVGHMVEYTDDELKERAMSGRFVADAVEEAITHRTQYLGDQKAASRQNRMSMDGYSDPLGYQDDKHRVIEWYTRAYVKPKITDDLKDDVNVLSEEIVLWVHQASGKTLGWTYLHRVSPGGIRPIFKSDFIRIPRRSTGIGVPELLHTTSEAVDAAHNLQVDNGVLATTPWGVYRSSSGLKADEIRYQRGMLYPVDDINDVRMMQFPYVPGFASEQIAAHTGTAERLLTLSDLQLGRTPSKVGAFRTASGSNALQSEAGIQLEIKFDRIARTLSKFLQCLFRMARERMPETLYYRITGERGEPIFGHVNRDDLKGDFDFEIAVDVLGQSRVEAQQQAVLVMQTLINPAFMQSGVVSPSNLYYLAKNFLQKHRVKRIDNFISEPQGYEGEIITPHERLFRIFVGMIDGIEDTVRLSEDHQKALAIYDGFTKSDEFGFLKTEQIAALHRLMQKHQQMMAAQQAGGAPNMMGMQVPRDGMAPVEAGGTDAGTLGAPQGEVNGPVH